MIQHTELIAKLRKFANTLTANIMTGHDHPNSQDELDRLNSARFLREAADALQALEPDDSGIVPDSDKVICPGCSHQFTAIPGNVQARLQALERVPMTEEQPRLTVRLQSFPESNGKRNWTALLVRVDKWDGLIGSCGGITIDRGELWNRVAYEAERARFLIGERDTEPFILDYGDDIETPEQWAGEKGIRRTRALPTPPEIKGLEPVAWMHWLNGPVQLFLNKDEADLELERLNRDYPIGKEDRKMRPLVFGDVVNTCQNSIEFGALVEALSIMRGLSEDAEPVNRCITELLAFAKDHPGTYIFPSWDGSRVMKYLATSPQAAQTETQGPRP